MSSYQKEKGLQLYALEVIKQIIRKFLLADKTNGVVVQSVHLDFKFVGINMVILSIFSFHLIGLKLAGVLGIAVGCE